MRAAVAGTHPAHPLRGNISLPASGVKAWGASEKQLPRTSRLPPSSFAHAQPAAPTIFFL